MQVAESTMGVRGGLTVMRGWVCGWLVDGSRNDQENNAEIGKSVLTYPMTVCICQATTNKKNC
jgi:hypothetical protein